MGHFGQHPLLHGATSDRPLPAQLSDTELNDLFAACLPKLKKAARRMLPNQQDSEDALQDGLLLAFRNLHQFQGRSAFSTWLHSIVRNSSRMHYRKSNAQETVFPELNDAEDTPGFVETQCAETRPSPEELCIQNERSAILRKTTRELPDKYRIALNYFHLQGLGEKETARKLGMTSSALKAQLHRSRRILTTKIRRTYLSTGLKTRAFRRELSRDISAPRVRKARIPVSSLAQSEE